MKALVVQEKINELMAQFVTQVRGATAMGRTDINHISEIVLIPIFEAVYGLEGLKNLNTEEATIFQRLFGRPGGRIGDPSDIDNR